MLLAAANDALALTYDITDRDGLRVLTKDGEGIVRLTEKDRFCMTVPDWMCQLVDDGVTDDLLDDVNQALADVRYAHVLVRADDGSPSWQRDIADMNRPLDVEELAAHAFSNLLAIGGLAGLKRCQLDDCSKFFIARPNAKWCSTPCGSKHRVRRKRKRDLE